MHSKFINILTSKLTILVIFVCSAFFACFGCMSDSHAAEVAETHVGLYATFAQLNYTCGTDASSATLMYNNNSCHLGSRAQVNSIAFEPTYQTTLDAGGYFVEVYLRISNNANTANPVWYGASNGDYMQFVSEEQVSSTTADSITYRTYRLLYRYTGGTNLGPTNFKMSIATQGGMFGAESYKVLTLVFWKVAGSDTASIVNAINAQNQYLTDISQNLYTSTTRLGAIENYLSLLDDIGDDISDLRSGQEQANQDANDRYEDEKDTTYDEAQSGQENMENMANDIGSGWINFPNPFASMFNYFIDTCSVNIPTIASWINWDGTTVNSWWCQTSTLSTIRGSLTTILSFVGVLLTFTFIFKWLRTNQGEV